MNKNIVICLLLLFAVRGMAQSTVADIVNQTKKVVLLGADFRKARFIGNSGFIEVEKIQNIYLQQWNSTFLKEYNKYSLAEDLKMEPTNFSMSLESVLSLNESVNVKESITNEMNYELPKSEIAEMVKDYKTELTDGIGVVYIIESFNSFENVGTMYIVFFDLGSKSVFFKEKVTAKAGGFGVKNFWLRTIYNAKVENLPLWYKKWKKEFKKKK